MHTIKLKRAYDPPSKEDGTRIFVDRLWPRGIKKSDLQLDAWLKEVAPSQMLRKWFGHDPERWAEFKKKYREELKAHPQNWQGILKALEQDTVTLIYSAHDTEHNNAVVLKQFLDTKKT